VQLVQAYLAKLLTNKPKDQIMKARAIVLAALFVSFVPSITAQEEVHVDGRLQPILDEFFEHCKNYDIPYHQRLFQLKNIDIVQDLPLSEENTVLGMVVRNVSGEVEEIAISWAALLDPEILKVVAFHEFAHHFLDYKHTCQDCDEIMAVTNASYFNIARDWENQVTQLFISSPRYVAIQKMKRGATTYE